MKVPHIFLTTLHIVYISCKLATLCSHGFIPRVGVIVVESRPQVKGYPSLSCPGSQTNLGPMEIQLEATFF